MAPIVDLTETGSNSESQLREPGTQVAKIGVLSLDGLHALNIYSPKLKWYVNIMSALSSDHQQLHQ